MTRTLLAALSLMVLLAPGALADPTYEIPSTDALTAATLGTGATTADQSIGAVRTTNEETMASLNEVQALTLPASRAQTIIQAHGLAAESNIQAGAAWVGVASQWTSAAANQKTLEAFATVDATLDITSAGAGAAIAVTRAARAAVCTSDPVDVDGDPVPECTDASVVGVTTQTAAGFVGGAASQATDPARQEQAQDLADAAVREFLG